MKAAKAPRWGAKTRRGTPCQAAIWSVKSKRYTRCRNHGGCSTGPSTTGSQNKHSDVELFLWDHAFPRQAHKRDASRHI